MNEFWFLSRIMTQGSSSLLEAQVLTWLNVQLRETHNCNTDSILSILLWSRKEPEETLSALMVKKETICTKCGASCVRRTLESYIAGVGREGLIWVSIVCGVGELYLKGYTNVREMIMRFEKGWKGNLFCLITTFAVFTNSCVSWRLTFYLRSHFSWFLVKWSWVHK